MIKKRLNLAYCNLNNDRNVLYAVLNGSDVIGRAEKTDTDSPRIQYEYSVQNVPELNVKAHTRTGFKTRKAAVAEMRKILEINWPERPRTRMRNE